jgi:hypothetical protein
MSSADTSQNLDIPLSTRTKPCCCGGDAYFTRYCGAWVCQKCDAHLGLARCYCGWASSGGNGRVELVEMGENLEEES